MTDIFLALNEKLTHVRLGCATLHPQAVRVIVEIPRTQHALLVPE